MMKPLTATPHGVLDYVSAILLLASPWLFGFNHISTTATYTMVTIASTIIIVSLLTNYPLGVIKAIPFPTHGILETIGAIGLLVSPWVLRFADIAPARNVAIIFAIAYFIVIALTNYHSVANNNPYRNNQSMHRPSH